MDQAIPTKPVRMTMSEYFAAEAVAEFKSEYRNGRVVAMAGGTIEHSRFIFRFNTHTGRRLSGTDCEGFNSDLKIGIPRRPFTHYPDLSVICGPVQLDDRDEGGRTATNPTLIVEVLSPTTEAYDRSDKFAHYRLIDTFREYVLVSQHKALVETFFRKDDGTWVFSVAEGVEASVKLTSLGIEVPSAEIYAGITFAPEEEPVEAEAAR